MTSAYVPGGIPANSHTAAWSLIGAATCLSALLESEGKALGVSNSVQITWPVELRRLTARTCKTAPAGVACAAGVAAAGIADAGVAAAASSIRMLARVPAIIAMCRSRCACTRRAIFRRTFHIALSNYLISDRIDRHRDAHFADSDSHRVPRCTVDTYRRAKVSENSSAHAAARISLARLRSSA